MRRSILFRLAFLVLLAMNVQGAVYADAKDAYFNASLDVEQLKGAGLPYESLEDALLQMDGALKGKDPVLLFQTALSLNETDEGRPLAERYFALLDEASRSGLRPGQNFSFVIERAQWIANKKQSAFDANDALVGFLDELEQVNETVNLSRVDFLLEEAKNAFEVERFEEVPSLVGDAREELDLALLAAARERALVRLARRNVVSYVQDHFKGVLMSLAVLFLLVVWAYLEGRVLFAKNKLRFIHEQLKVAQHMLVNAQKEYYGGSIGRVNYHNQMESQRQKIRSLKGSVGGWEQMLSKYKKSSVIGRFRR